MHFYNEMGSQGEDSIDGKMGGSDILMHTVGCGRINAFFK